MVEIFRSETFDRWLGRLRDTRAKARIGIRLDRLAAGNAGDTKSVGNGILEMRIDYGPGYRIYFIWRGNVAVVLLCGGDKSTQAADIERAKSIAGDWKD